MDRSRRPSNDFDKRRPCTVLSNKAQVDGTNPVQLANFFASRNRSMLFPSDEARPKGTLRFLAGWTARQPPRTHWRAARSDSPWMQSFRRPTIGAIAIVSRI